MDFLSHLEAALGEGAGDDGAKATDRKDAVYRQAGTSQVAAGLDLGEHPLQRGQQFVKALPGAGRDGDDGRSLQHRPLHRLGHVGGDQFNPLLAFGQVHLGQGNDACANPQQVEDGQVFPRLRHHALVGSDDKKGGVNATHARQHILNKVPVPGHIHDAGWFAAGEREPGKAQVYCHLPLLLLAEPVGVNAGESVNEGGFTVIYVTSGADDVHIAYRSCCPLRRIASCSSMGAINASCVSWAVLSRWVASARRVSQRVSS